MGLPAESVALSCCSPSPIVVTGAIEVTFAEEPTIASHFVLGAATSADSDRAVGDVGPVLTVGDDIPGGVLSRRREPRLPLSV